MKRNILSLLILFSCFISIHAIAQDVINNSHIAFTIQEKDMLPESLAYDAQTQSFFVGSTRRGKIVKITSDGKVIDFIKSQQDGLWMVIGIKIDSQRRHLWVCSSGGENLIGYNLKDNSDGRPAGIFKFNLDNGELIKSYKLDKKGEVHFFNDLTIARDGSVYATHMFQNSSIYKIDAGTDRLEVFAKDQSVAFPNGISLADNGRYAFIAHSEGIAKLNLESKEFTNLPAPEGASLARRESIDGLTYYKWSLIGVQSDIKQVIRLSLNDEGTGFDEYTILEKNHPMMNRPTTGMILNGEFYYISNAQFDSFNQDGTLFPLDRLFEPTILKVKLN